MLVDKIVNIDHNLSKKKKKTEWEREQREQRKMCIFHFIDQGIYTVLFIHHMSK